MGNTGDHFVQSAVFDLFVNMILVVFHTLILKILYFI